MEDTEHKHKPETIGEELWSIHLKRSRGREEENDFDHPRKREHVGEELWDVHMVRSRGRAAEGEDDDAGDKKVKATDSVASSPPRRYNLRSKDAKKTTA